MLQAAAPAPRRRRRRSQKIAFSALKVPPMPRSRTASPVKLRAAAARASSPAASPVKSPGGKTSPRLEMSMTEHELSEMIVAKERWERMGWTRPQSPFFATTEDTIQLQPSAAVEGRRGSRSSNSSSSDSGSAEAGPLVWYKAAAQRRNAAGLPGGRLPSLRSSSDAASGGRDAQDSGITGAAEPERQQVAIRSVYATLQDHVDDPDVVVLALRALFVLLYRNGSHATRGSEREEFLSDVLHGMRTHPNDAEVVNAAHAVVGLFTRVRSLPPIDLDASHDLDVEDYFAWQDERDRQLQAAQNLLLRFQQLQIRKAFGSWFDATRQRKTLVAMLRRWVQLEMSDRWAQWVHRCVSERAVRRESWVKTAAKAHDAGDWKAAINASELALSLGGHLLARAQANLPLSEEVSDAVLEVGSYSAACALQEQYGADEVYTAQKDTDGRALDLLESAVEGQRHHEDLVLSRAITRFTLMLVRKAFSGWQLAVNERCRVADIVNRARAHWINMEKAAAFEGWYAGMIRQQEVRKLLTRASVIWRNKELMARFNQWCWYCQCCEDERAEEVRQKAAERQRRREAWLLKQLFKGVGDSEFEGMDTTAGGGGVQIADRAESEMRRLAQQEITAEEEIFEDEEEVADRGRPLIPVGPSKVMLRVDHVNGAEKAVPTVVRGGKPPMEKSVEVRVSVHNFPFAFAEQCIPGPFLSQIAGGGCVCRTRRFSSVYSWEIWLLNGATLRCWRPTWSFCSRTRGARWGSPGARGIAMEQTRSSWRGWKRPAKPCGKGPQRVSCSSV